MAENRVGCHTSGQNEHCVDDAPTSPIPKRPPSRPPLNLADWEIQLIALILYFETNSEPGHYDIIAWIIINRLMSPLFPNSIEDIVVSPQFHAGLTLLGDNGHYQQGIFAGYMDPARVEGWGYSNVLSGQALSDAAYSYYATKYPGIVTALEKVKETIAKYNSGQVDPTQGALYYAHVPKEGAMVIVENVRKQAEIDEKSTSLTVGMKDGINKAIIFSNIYDPPYGKYPMPNGYCKIWMPAACQQ
ncbi:MAG: cell wall hydrolase [Anaerolineae bacterium]|nr:cell wall hydrolase [Anaerolineae bacterium]